MNKIIERFKHDDWVTYFSGDTWSPLGFSHWIRLFTLRPFSDDLDYFVNQTVIVCDGKTTTCFVRESERELFGKKIVDKVKKDISYVKHICNGLKSGADHILSIYRKKREGFTCEEYLEYKKVFLQEYYPYHIKVKNVVDFLPKELLDTHLPALQEARVHAEPVFSEEIGFMVKVADFVSRKSGYKKESILYSLSDELTEYWKHGKNLPSEKVLEERSKGCIIFFEKEGIVGVLSGFETAEFGSIFLVNKDTDLIQGHMAFKGKAEGKIRIVFDPDNAGEFNDGDILVAPWTRPEYLPIMHKAGAFITDGGGILSHAAIVAREMRKPCIIGTKIATKVLKDGDMVEVDADRGTVTIVKRG